MFKLTLKLFVTSVVVFGVASLFSGGKAAAAVPVDGGQCPAGAPNGTVVPTNSSGQSVWGYQGGESVNNFGGIIVRAHNGVNGNNINAAYTLNSYLPPADSGDSYNIPSGDDRNARIFPLSNTGNQNPLSRTTNHAFATGETLYNNESPGNPGGGAFACTGWSALGPGSPGEAGDNWGMDCGEYEYIGGNLAKPDQDIPTHFYINGLNDNYGGVSGTWEIQVNGSDTPGTNNDVASPMNPTTIGKYFTIPNGTSTRIDLVWHPTTWTLSGDSKVNGVDASVANNATPLPVKAGGRLNFTHYVSSGGVSATYSWSVISGSVPGGMPAGTAPPNPNPASSGYTIPSDTAPGTKYCEHIQYSFPNGPNSSGIGASQAACAEVQPAGGKTQATGACQQLSVTENAGTTKARTFVTIQGVTVGRVHYQEGSTNKWWPSADGPGNLGQSDAAAFVGPGSGHDPPDSPNVSGAPAQDGEKNTSITKTWYYQPVNTNSITVTYRSDTLSGSTWSNGATQYLHWNPDGTYFWNPAPASIPCFSATCTITSVTGDIQPGSYVAAGGTMHITGTYTNTSPPPDYLTLWNPVLQYSANGQDYPAGGIANQVLGGGGSYDFSFDVPETSGGPNVDNLSFTPVYFNNMAIGPACGYSVWSYQQFSASAVPYSKLHPTNEDATYDACYAYVSVGGTGHAVNLSTHSTFTKNGVDLVPEVYGGTYGPGTTYTLGGNAPDGVDCANTVSDGYDQFCTNITLNYTSGWVGPDNNVVDGVGGREPPNAPPSCDNETNEPYFKVYGSGAAADLQSVEKPDISGTLTCSAPPPQSGLLAGWNDNADDGASRGAGSQLSSLALIKITGFASGQTSIFRKSPTPGADLSFANSGNDAAHNPIVPTATQDSPALGGSFGSQAQCVKPPSLTGTAQNPSPGNVNLNGGDTTGTGVSKSYKGNVRLSNSLPTLSGNTSVYVDGDVYINSNLKLNQAGWAITSTGKTTVPSFTLTVTGNIYISPNVTNLDGLYTSSGTIYTCGQISPIDYKPMATAQVYDRCNNQLLITGSVMANQVKMMRTYGSLRDEKPVTGTQIVNVSDNDGAVAWNRYYCGAPGGVYPGTHFYQTGTSPPVPGTPGGCGFEGTIGYILPPSNGGRTPGSAPLYVVNGSNGIDYYYADYGSASFDGGRPCAGGQFPCSPTLVGYYQTSPVAGTIPVYGEYQGNVFTGVHFYTTSYEEYVNVANTVGAGGIPLGVVAYVYSAPGQGVTYTPTAEPTPLGPNLTPTCSHAGVKIVAYTCAGEVLQFSPELYLGNQTIDKDSNGATQYDSITSLPPVL